ncbi:MAG: sugar ABC transporter substrate-binding protein [Lachnospiraceae bacterium]|nr:sugar ABC transporter substrate-binding protein [Lachnospiraceae bacterium]
MKKKLLALILSAAMVFSLAACGDTNSGTGDTKEPTVEEGKEEAEEPAEEPAKEDEGSAGGEKQTIKIGMAWAILDDGQTNLTNAIMGCFEEEYPDYEIEATLTNADGDIATLINDVESLIAKNPDMIYIMNSVGDSGIIPAIDACKEAGIPVGIGVALADEADYTYLYEGFSQYACGQMQAKYMEDNYDENAEYNVACITGDPGSTAGAERTQGFVENFVDKHDNAKVVIQGEGNWSTDDSQALVDDWLISHPEINVVVCVNDDEAQGAINACKAAGREDVIVLGIDGSDLGKANVESGDQAATVGINFGGVASACAKAMVDCALGNLDSNEVKLTTENLDLIVRE